jgi:hypothetical protein
MALLIIRAWCQHGSPRPLRAEIHSTGDVSLSFEHVLTSADADRVVETVRAFLAHVVSGSSA